MKLCGVICTCQNIPNCNCELISNIGATLADTVSPAFLNSEGKHVLLVDPLEGLCDPLPSSYVSPLCTLAIQKANAEGTVGPVTVSKKCTFTRCKLVLWFGLLPHRTPQVCGLKELPLSCSSFPLVSFLVHQPFWARILSLIFNRN